jgi:predicted dehydrogenase
VDAARELGGSPYSDYGAFLADPAVDAVVICSPHALHHPMSLAALQAGKSVICEKPLTLSVTEAEELCRVAATTGLPTAVNFTYHSLPGHRFVARLLSEGAIGRLRHLDLSYWQARQGMPGAPVGDAILDVGAHLLDLATWWADSAGAGPITSIAGHDDGGTEKGVRIWSALARTTGDALLAIGADRLAAGWRNGMVGRLVGDAGCLTLTFDTDVTEVRLARFGDGAAEGVAQVLEIPVELAVGYRDFPGFHVDRLVAALRGQIDFPDFFYGLRIQRLIGASNDAVRSRSWVDVDIGRS